MKTPISCAWLTLFFLFPLGVAAEQPSGYDAARWDPIHFQPQIAEASDEQCLACHAEIIERRPLRESPAGVKASDTLAWYQTTPTYEGPQETFHRRHLVTDLAQELMDLRCNTCHQGSDPREEAPYPPVRGKTDFALRKSVNPDTCLMCHGQFDYKIMNMPGDWNEFGHMFQDNCLICHASIRTTRHQVNFLKPEAIEAEAKDSAEACYGCHGGRSWYRIAYPYPRHDWPGMPKAKPEWAEDRPKQSAARFFEGTDTAAK